MTSVESWRIRYNKSTLPRNSPRLGSWLLHQLLLHWLGDQPCAVVISDISPCPFDHHKESIAEADEKEQVNEQPRQPGKVAGDMNFPGEVGNRARASNGGETAFVPVFKMLARLPFHGSFDLPRSELAHLDRRRRNSGNWLAIFALG